MCELTVDVTDCFSDMIRVVLHLAELPSQKIVQDDAIIRGERGNLSGHVERRSRQQRRLVMDKLVPVGRVLTIAR